MESIECRCCPRIVPCHCEGVRSTLKTLAYDCGNPKTLAYDCGNPVQYVCGHSPAVLFYLLDRHALLAMTMGSKGINANSLTTLPCGHPSNGGELATYRCRIKFLSAEGWATSGPARPVAWVVSPGWLLYPTPPSCSARHPPPGGRWAFECGDVSFIPLRKQMYIHTCRWRLYRIHPPGRT